MDLARASLWSRANHVHWTQQDVLNVKPTCNDRNYLGAAPTSPGQTHFRDYACGRKSSRFPVLEVLPLTMVFPQVQEPWVRFAWPHVRCQPASQHPAPGLASHRAT